MLALIALTLTVVYLLLNLAAVAARNHKAHKFYRTRSPQLPVVPNPNIFSGHLFEIIAPGKNWRIIEELHEKYGPTFGYYVVDQPWVSTKDIDLIKSIEVDAAHRHINRAFFGLPFAEFNHSVFQIDDDRWRRVRRVISPALTNHKVRSDEVSLDVESVVADLAASLERRAAKSASNSFIVDARDLFERYTLAVIFLVTYKRQNQINFDCDQDVWTHTIVKGAREITNPIVQSSMMFPFLRPLCSFLAQYHSSGRVQVKIIDYITKATDAYRSARGQHDTIQRRLSLATGQPEKAFAEVKTHGQFKRRLVDTIIDGYIDKKINYDNFIGSLLFLLLAGFMTTADTISCLVWQLAKNLDIQEKLRQVIRTEGIDADYVVWCINETIRFHPAVPLGTGRILGEDVTVNGLLLAKGTFVMPSTRSIHHDPSIWPEPKRFNPDRWRHQADFHPAAFVGFGLGPRNCVGGKLAVHEIKLVMRMILSNYKIEVCDGTPSEWHFSTPGMIYTLNDDPIKVKFTALLEKTEI